MVKIQYRSWKYAGFFALAIICGVINGLYPSEFGMDAARFISNVFIKLFKFISVPIIGITICTTMLKLEVKSHKVFYGREHYSIP